MAIARMRKVTAIVSLGLLDEVIDLLQKQGALEIVSAEDRLPLFEVSPDDGELYEVETDLAKARYIRETLMPYHKNKAAMSMFVSEKFHLSEDDYQAAVFDDEYEGLYTLCEDITAAIADLRMERSDMAARLQALEPWENCSVPFAQWQGTEHTGFYAGVATPKSLEAVYAAFAEPSAPLVDIEEFAPAAHGRNGASEAKSSAFIVRMLAEDETVVRSLLHDAGAREASFDKSLCETPAEKIALLKERRASHRNDLKAYQLELRELAKKYFARTTVLIQALGSAYDRVMIRTRFAHTETVFVVEGWICADQEDALIRTFEPYAAQTDLSFDDPGPQDEPPVALENPGWLEPFELLTDLYGRPQYGRLDPTPFIAPFFVFFVAVCIGDVGYGLMMAAAFTVIMTRLDVAPNVTKFCRLMIYGGLAAVPIGMLMGGYFAFPFESLPPFLQSLRIINPLEEIVTFLIAAMVVGAFQLTVGIVIAAYEHFRGGRWQVALGSKLSVFVFVGSIAAFVLSGASQLWILLGGLALTTLMQGYGLFHQASPEERTVKKAAVSVFSGLYEVYGMTRLLNEALSYTRLAALGLAGALVGMVFNILARMVMEPALSSFTAGGGAVISGILLMLAVVLIFVVGHSFNVLINLIGAFVHPMRLQFVEFFGMFYDAGGAGFKPFAYRKENLVFEDKE